MMNNIEQIVMNVLENHSGKCLDNEEEREVVAIKCQWHLLSNPYSKLQSLQEESYCMTMMVKPLSIQASVTLAMIETVCKQLTHLS